VVSRLADKLRQREVIDCHSERVVIFLMLITKKRITAQQSCRAAKSFFQGEYTVMSRCLVLLPSIASHRAVHLHHLSHKQTVRVLVVKLDDIGQLIRLNSVVDWVGILHLVADPVKRVSIVRHTIRP
jgi:hypothetical protein